MDYTSHVICCLHKFCKFTIPIHKWKVCRINCLFTRFQQGSNMNFQYLLPLSALGSFRLLETWRVFSIAVSEAWGPKPPDHCNWQLILTLGALYNPQTDDNDINFMDIDMNSVTWLHRIFWNIEKWNYIWILCILSI